MKTLSNLSSYSIISPAGFRKLELLTTVREVPARLRPFAVVYNIQDNYISGVCLVPSKTKKALRVFINMRVYSAEGEFLGLVIAFYDRCKVSITRENIEFRFKKNEVLYG